MNATRRLCRSSLVIPALLAVWVTPPRLMAQSASEAGSDYLRQVRQMTEIAAQKMETDVRAALRDAQRTGKTDLAAAAEALKQMLVTVEQDSVVPPARRDALVRTLKDRIAALERQSKRPAAAPPAPSPVNQRRVAEEERRAAEYKKIRAAMERIRGLQKDGQTDEARRDAEELAKQHSTNPTLQAAERTAAAARPGRRQPQPAHRDGATARRPLARYQPFCDPSARGDGLSGGLDEARQWPFGDGRRPERRG